MIHTQNEGIYHALLAQLDKLERHNRQGSYKTRQRYYEAMQRFCRFLADVYHLQKLANISGKHLVAYVRHLQENGKAASTIKTELAAIRFWHDRGVGAVWTADGQGQGRTCPKRPCDGGSGKAGAAGAKSRRPAGA